MSEDPTRNAGSPGRLSVIHDQHQQATYPEDDWRLVQRDGAIHLVDATGQDVPITGRSGRIIERAPRLLLLAYRLLEHLDLFGQLKGEADALIGQVNGVTPTTTPVLDLIARAQAAARARGDFTSPEDAQVQARAVYLEEALIGLADSWDTAMRRQHCPDCGIDLGDKPHPAKKECPRGFAQMILDGVEP